MQSDSVKIIYKGDTYYGKVITSENIEEIRKDIKVGYYGIVKEGSVVFYMRSGFDGFYMIMSPDEKDIQIIKE